MFKHFVKQLVCIPQRSISPFTIPFRSCSSSSLVKGCDYEHWLVVLNPPKGYPVRDEIIAGCINTLALALGSDEAARTSIYSVSTKYYYAFGCKVSEKILHKIKSLPDVRWILLDSYVNVRENDYGGEPFVDGKAVPYKEKYHADWLRDQIGTTDTTKSRYRNAEKEYKYT